MGPEKPDVKLKQVKQHADCMTWHAWCAMCIGDQCHKRYKLISIN